MGWTTHLALGLCNIGFNSGSFRFRESLVFCRFVSDRDWPSLEEDWRRRRRSRQHRKSSKFMISTANAIANSPAQS